MGMSLIGHGVSFSRSAWISCLWIARSFGWEPEGTTQENDLCNKWDGTYFTNDYQSVSDKDAKNLSIALNRAIYAFEHNEKLTLRQMEAVEQRGINLDNLRTLQKCADERGFLIG